MTWTYETVESFEPHVNIVYVRKMNKFIWISRQKVLGKLNSRRAAQLNSDIAYIYQ